MGYRMRLLAAALLALVFFDAVILADYWTRGRHWDLTENQRHRLSPGSRDLLASLDHPVRLRFFFSAAALTRFAYLHNHGAAARDLLEAIARAGEGKIRVEWVEPEPFSPEEDLALGVDLAPLPLPSGENAWLGVEGVNEIGGQAVIAQLVPERSEYLEYDLMRLIAGLGKAEKPVLGMITNLPLDTGPAGLPAALAGEGKPFLIYRELVERFTLRFLERDFAAVPQSLDALMIAHPKDLSPRALFAIDQYLMSGGRILLFLDPHSEISLLASSRAAAPVQGYSLRSDLPGLLEGWGVLYDPARLLADRALAQEVVLRHDAGQRQIPYLLWPGFEGAEHINQAHPATKGLALIQMASTGTLLPAKQAAARFIPLLTGSRDSALMDFDAIAAAPAPGAILARFQPDEAIYHVAALLTGPFASAYDSPPFFAENRPGEAPPPFRARSSSDAQLAVIADSDIFDDRFWAEQQQIGTSEFVRPYADNASLILNLADYFSGAPQLLGLRARARAVHPFTRILTMEEEAQKLRQDEIRQLEAQIAAGQEKLATAGPEQRRQLLESRRRLREIRLSLRQAVDALFFNLRLLNLAAMPGLLLLLSLGLWLFRRPTE